MRKFIVSDLHGNLEMYFQIMGYLENINKDDEVTLYINGDLIDRGTGSAYMLLDVMDRIKNKKGFPIKYLAGNHELMMYQTSLNKEGNLWPKASIWYVRNGGLITLDGLRTLANEEKEEEVLKFISELNIYHKFNEKINDKKIVLVHAKRPLVVKDECDLKLKDNNKKVEKALWSRTDELSKIGKNKYFTIIGHTPVINEKGYRYFDEYNYLNIDGGCSYYVRGVFDYNHLPLVEIDESGKLIILTFNNQNEIILGHQFVDGINVQMENNELEKRRKYTDKDVKKKILSLE